MALTENAEFGPHLARWARPQEFKGQKSFPHNNRGLLAGPFVVISYRRMPSEGDCRIRPRLAYIEY